MRAMHNRVAGTLAAIVLAVVLAASAAAMGGPVLGSRQFYKPGATIGWGTAHPKEVYNGGDPSGDVTHIRWRDWGAKVIYGQGLTHTFKPHGGYYRQMVPIELKASRLSRCSRHGPRAYTRLHVRVVTRPGGNYGPWGPWSSHDGNICLTTAQMFPAQDVSVSTSLPRSG